MRCPVEEGRAALCHRVGDAQHEGPALGDECAVVEQGARTVQGPARERLGGGGADVADRVRGPGDVEEFTEAGVLGIGELP